MILRTATQRVHTRVHRPRQKTPWLDWMTVPSLLILAVVLGYPIVRTIQLSFMEHELLNEGDATWTGVANFEELINDPLFWTALSNTAVYTGASVAIGALAGLVLALATENLGGPWRYIRALLMTPWAVPVIVVAYLFRYIFDENVGILNSVLLQVGIIDQSIPFLSSRDWAMLAVVAANFWHQTPFYYLMFTAGLASISTEVIESARVDRAGSWRMFTRIKLPLLRGPASVALLMMTIANFNDFAKVWAMTEGGPGYSTTTLVVYVYRLAFTSFEMGYASTVGVVWLALLLILGWFYIRLLRREAP